MAVEEMFVRNDQIKLETCSILIACERDPGLAENVATLTPTVDVTDTKLKGILVRKGDERVKTNCAQVVRTSKTIGTYNNLRYASLHKTHARQTTTVSVKTY